MLLNFLTLKEVRSVTWANRHTDYATSSTCHRAAEVEALTVDHHRGGAVFDHLPAVGRASVLACVVERDVFQDEHVGQLQGARHPLLMRTDFWLGEVLHRQEARRKESTSVI